MHDSHRLIDATLKALAGGRFVCLTMVLLVSLVGCFPSYKFKDLSARGQQSAYGTQPGYHELSQHFAVKVDKGRMQFFYLGKTGNEPRKAIGTILAMWYDFSNYGSREIAFAISDDGTRMLFYDEPGLSKGGPANAPRADLYLFDIDVDRPELIHKDGHRIAFVCGERPRNFIYLGKMVADRYDSETYFYSTERDEISFEEIQKKLTEAGRGGEAFCESICDAIRRGGCAYDASSPGF